ncbi:MAG: tetratricopeptide repeat protein [Planktomarina sp.]
MLFARIVVLSLFSALASFSYAATLPDAQRALMTGQYPQAIVMAQEIEGQYPVDAALIRSRSYLELGQIEQAKAYANLAIQMVPDAAQPRVLLAMAYMREGKLRRADLTLRRALDLAQSPQERAGITQILRQLNKDIRFKLSGGFALAPSDNLANATHATTVTIAATGTTTAFNATDSIEGGVGLNVWGTLSYVVPLQREGKVTFFGSQSSKRFQEKHFNHDTWAYGMDVRLPITQTGQQFNFSIKRSDYYRAGINKSLSDIYQIGMVHPMDGRPAHLSRKNVSVFARYMDTKLEYLNIGTTIDYYTTSWGVNYVWPAGRNGSWRLGFTSADRRSRSSTIANRQYTVHGGRRFEFNKSGLLVDMSASLKWAQWKRLEFALVPRWEKDTNISITLQRPKTSFYGLTPFMRLSYLDRQSNQNIREVQSHDVFIGFQNAF